MCVYKDNPLFCRGGSKLKFLPEIWSPITGGKNYFRKMAASWLYFYTKIDRPISKIG